MNKEEHERYLALHGLPYKRPRPNLVTLPEDHPLYCMTHKGRVAEARLIMAEHIGRPLTRNEIVCFKDDFPLNTNIDNLELRDRRYIWDNSVEWGTERDAEESEHYSIGKIEEERIASYLSNQGYQVVDISRTKHYNPNGTTTYSPFDIYAWSDKYSFLADIKYRSSKGDIFFKPNLMEMYHTYWNQVKVSSRLIIIVTPKMPDSFIDIDDVSSNDSICIVERWKTVPVSALVSRLSGDSYKDTRKLRFLHIEPCSDSPSGYKVLGTFPYPQNNKENE